MSYLNQAKYAAQEMGIQFAEPIAEAWIEGRVFYPFDCEALDNYHHEKHVSQDFTLLQAAMVLEELKEYEETDEGLWHGLKAKDAISAQAAYTYAATVLAMMEVMLEGLRDDPQIDRFLEKEDYSGLTEFIKSSLPNFYPTTVAK